MVILKKILKRRVVQLSLFLFCTVVAGSIFTGSRTEAAVSEGFDAEQKYMASCFACHNTGAAGAPIVGSAGAADWYSRLEKGMDVLVRHVIEGYNDCPPKGLCFDCTDDDLRAIVEYMIDHSK
jgi:cytochrome c5